MPIQVGLALECDSGISRSTARLLARTWNNEFFPGLIAVGIKMPNEVLFAQERLQRNGS